MKIFRFLFKILIFVIISIMSISFSSSAVKDQSSNPTVFLRTNRYQLGNFLNKKIHVEGNFFRESDKKISPIHFTKAYDKIVVDTIYCMN